MTLAQVQDHQGLILQMISDNNVDSVPLNDADEYENADLIWRVRCASISQSLISFEKIVLMITLHHQ